MSSQQKGSYQTIVEVYRQTRSVNQTVEKTGISKQTVQKVLLTEGLWESKRSRDVLRLKNEGHTTEEIAELLHISVKAVQAYSPYSRKPYGSTTTKNSVKSKKKRDKMQTAAKRQIQGPTMPDLPQSVNMDLEYIDLGEVLTEKPVEAENSISKKKKAASLFKLHLELVQDGGGTPIRLNSVDEELLREYAKYKEGFSRDIIVPAEMTLHSLHYAIQKLFGWENSHLRQFSLLPKDFSAITKGMTSLWEGLCGVYFRFPQNDDQEPYWDDDYEGLQSFKTWLKRKYKGPYELYGIRDTYYDNQAQVTRFRKEFEKETKQTIALTLDELTEQVWLGGDYNCLLERLRISELFVPNSIALPTLSEWESYIQKSISDVRDVFNDTPEDFAVKYMQRVIEMQYSVRRDNNAMLQIRILREKTEPKLMPFVHDIIYQYDFGDGWCIRITCEEGYYYNDLFDAADGRYVAAKINDRDFVAGRDYYRSGDDRRVDDQLNEVLRYVEWKKHPACVATDGMYLVDDVGGVYGFVDFIRTLHGTDKQEAQEMQEWAEGLGWSPRMNKPEKML